MHQHIDNTNPNTYPAGAIVKESGNYICVPCGYKIYLEKGDEFPPCIECIKKQEYVMDGDEGLWEKVV